jgi:hypothetical protein
MLPSQHLHRVCLVLAAWAETSSAGKWHVDRPIVRGSLATSSRRAGDTASRSWPVRTQIARPTGPLSPTHVAVWYRDQR